ncbi:restriction endonuclease subunit S [Candidatus Palauibacter sp.]|uniref:restriction endonuclease subunit S n=1 Tax=Candidatus Palauibacter sp. TaxID=3101350 RepID=UPI003B5206E4
MKWNMIPLGDIALRRGGSVDPKKHQDEVFELYSIPAFDAGAPEVVPGSSIGSSKKAVEPNDVMISRIVPHIRRACVVRPANQHRQIASGEWIILRDERIWPNFLRWLLVGDVFHSAFMRTVSGVGGSLLRARPAEVFKIKIPLPPLDEQQRIAGILDAADALRAKRREAIAQLDILLESTFLDMFGDPVTNPKGWPLTSLPSISELRDGPFGSNLKTSHYVEGGVRVIRLQNVGVGEMRNDDLAFISEEHFASLPRNHCQPGDVIIGTMGDPNLRAFIVPLTLARAINKADCIRMRVDTTRVNAVYACWLLNNPRVVSIATGLVRGQTRGRISLGRLKELQVHLPPLELQHRFAAVVAAIEQQRASQRTHLAELDSLFASLQSHAFRGDL